MLALKKALLASSLLGASKVTQRFLALARNVFVARILLPEDFGLAATFWITTSFARTVTELGLKQWLVQYDHGDTDAAGALFQTLMLARGALIGVVLFASAPMIASLFNAEEATWAFQLIALLPLIGGLQHRDLERVQRQLRFGPYVTANLIPEVVITLAAVPLALYLRDYRVFLCTALMGVCLTVCLSHILAERPYRLGWHRRYFKQAFAFGWPLLINSILMYSSLQGDRILLAKFYSKADLGVYSVAVGLLMSIVGVALVAVNPVVLPLMSGIRKDRSGFDRLYRLHMGIMCGLAIVLGSFFIAIGPLITLVIYGSKYSMAGAVIGWLGISESLRLLRAPATNAAMALGDTLNTMYTNLVKQSGIAIALLLALCEYELIWIAISSIVGEMFALAFSVVLLTVRHSIAIGTMLKSLFAAATAFLIVIPTSLYIHRFQDWRLDVTLFLMILFIAIPIFFVVFPECRFMVRDLFRTNQSNVFTSANADRG